MGLWPDFIFGVDQLTGTAVFNNTIPPLPAGTAYLTAAGVGRVAVSCYGDLHCSGQCRPTECLVYTQDQGWVNPRDLAGYTPPQLEYREEAFALALNDKIWVIGGKHPNQSDIVVNTVEIFDPHCSTATTHSCVDWDTGPELLEPVYDTCAVEYHGDVYVFGGHGEGVWPLSKVMKMNASRSTWTYLADMPVDRYGHGCAVYEDNIYISGGYSSNGRLSRVDVFDPSTESWSQIGDMNFQRNNHHMAVVNSQLTVVGGYGALASEYWAPRDLDTIEEYHPDIDRWVGRELHLSLPRRSFGAAVVGNSSN